MLCLWNTYYAESPYKPVVCPDHEKCGLENGKQEVELVLNIWQLQALHYKKGLESIFCGDPRHAPQFACALQPDVHTDELHNYLKERQRAPDRNARLPKEWDQQKYLECVISSGQADVSSGKHLVHIFLEENPDKQ